MDNPGRLHYLKAVTGLAEVFGWPKVTDVKSNGKLLPPYHSPLAVGEETKGSGFPFVLGELSELPQADLVLVIGADLTPELPPLGWAVNEARQKDNFKLIVANPRATKFDRYADISLRYRPGAERLLLAGLMKAFLSAQSDWTPAIPAKGIEELQEILKKYGPKELAIKCGLEDFAPFEAAAALLAQAQAPAIIFGTELLGQDKAEQTVMALADLFLLVGRPEVPGSALYPVAEKANTRGVCEVGVLPDRLPGYLPLDDQNAAAFWGGKAVVKEPGLDLLAMLNKLEEDDPAAPQALYALGGDLLRFLPNRSRAEKFLGKLKFIVVQIHRGAGRFLKRFRQDGRRGAARGHSRRAGRHLHLQRRAVGGADQGLVSQWRQARLADYQRIGRQDGLSRSSPQPRPHLPGAGQTDASLDGPGPSEKCGPDRHSSRGCRPVRAL
jgi:hypothetical protein